MASQQVLVGPRRTAAHHKQVASDAASCDKKQSLQLLPANKENNMLLFSDLSPRWKSDKRRTLPVEALVHGGKEEGNFLIGTIYIRSNNFLTF